MTNTEHRLPSYSSSLNTEPSLYHEVIKADGIDCAKVIGHKDGTYEFIIDSNMARSRGYKTVADCKSMLFKVLEG